MRDRAEPQADPTAGVSNVPWVVTQVSVLPGYRLLVEFVDGTKGEVDASRQILAPSAGVFAALRDPLRFAEAYVDDGAVTWPGELDLAPDAMYDEIRKRGFWVLEPF
jgi:CubicO group peptidase (beta-lactamase class C family)